MLNTIAIQQRKSLRWVGTLSFPNLSACARRSSRRTLAQPAVAEALNHEVGFVDGTKNWSRTFPVKADESNPGIGDHALDIIELACFQYRGGAIGNAALPFDSDVQFRRRADKGDRLIRFPLGRSELRLEEAHNAIEVIGRKYRKDALCLAGPVMNDGARIAVNPVGDTEPIAYFIWPVRRLQAIPARVLSLLKAIGAAAHSVGEGASEGYGLPHREGDRRGKGGHF